MIDRHSADRMLAAEAEVRNRRADEALALVEQLRGRGYNEHL